MASGTCGICAQREEHDNEFDVGVALAMHHLKKHTGLEARERYELLMGACDRCAGSGYIDPGMTRVCPKCGGSGQQ